MNEQPNPLVDQLGRPLADLRISVTDRCNFRCTYCMPKDVFNQGYPFLRRDDLLSYEEIARCVKIFSGLGVSKVRLTGGEPLLRRDLGELIGKISQCHAIKDIAMTTNGSLLGSGMAHQLRESGLHRVTVSLDSLDKKTFRQLADVSVGPDQVLNGIHAAVAAGLAVKVNMVVQRGVNDHEILDLARYFHGTPVTLRFIEYMDVGTTNDWRLSNVFSAREIVECIDYEMPLRAIDPNYPGEVAQRWEYVDGGGEIGVIASVTQPFCRQCSRLRMSANGQLYTCLFATQGADLRSLLRAQAGDAVIRDWLVDLWRARADRYSEERGSKPVAGQPVKRIEMSYIGG